MSVAVNKLTGSHVLEDMYLHQHCCENLTSQKIVFVCNSQLVMLGGIPLFKIFVKTLSSVTFIVMNTQCKISLINLC
jgi:hypothetical protein